MYKCLALKFHNFYKVFCGIVDDKVAHVSDVSFVQSLLHQIIVPRVQSCLPYFIEYNFGPYFVGPYFLAFFKVFNRQLKKNL